eukprot:2102007-Amphidinium_carterae.2
MVTLSRLLHFVWCCKGLSCCSLVFSRQRKVEPQTTHIVEVCAYTLALKHHSSMPGRTIIKLDK